LSKQRINGDLLSEIRTKLVQHTIALIYVDEFDQIYNIATGLLVDFCGHPMVATAAHCLELESDEWVGLYYGQADGNIIPRRDRHDLVLSGPYRQDWEETGIDVGLLVLRNSDLLTQAGKKFVELTNEAGRTLADGDNAFLVGFPKDKVERSILSGQDSFKTDLIPCFIDTELKWRDSIGYHYTYAKNKAVDCSSEGLDLPNGAGLSGAGLWVRGPDGRLLLIGINSSRSGSNGFAVKIESWMELAAQFIAQFRP